MAKIGTAYVEIKPDLSGLQSQVDQALGPLSGKFEKWGKAAAVGVGAIATAAGAAGKALYDIGGQFDDAYDSLRVTTGKTGKQLDGLEKTFKNVVKTTPTDFGSASDAVGQLNARLGLTGKPLESMSKRFLELSRITETDLNTNIESLTRTFGDWGIATGKQGDAMDKLFRASQKTGVPVAKLGDTLVKYGAPLRQLGFSFEQSAAMIGKFEKEGVNTQLVMGSLRVALGKMAKAGEDPQKTFQRVTGEIKNAGTAGEANAKALELFGARAGPDMAAAIREGRFELGSLTGQIAGGKDTILGAAKDTQDFSEKWQILKNRVLVGLEPLASRVFGAVGTAMDRLPQVVERLRITFDRLRGALSGAGGEGTRIQNVLTTLQGWMDTFKTTFSAAVDIATVAWRNFGDLFVRYAKNLIDTVMGVADGMRQVLSGLSDFVAGIFTGDWSRVWDGVKQIFAGIWDAMKAVVKGAWEQIKILAEAGVRAMLTAVRALGGQLLELGRWMLGKIVDGFQAVGNALASAGGWLKNRVVDAVEATAEGYAALGRWVVNRLVAGFKTVTEALGTVGGWLANRVVELVQLGGETLVAGGRWVVNRLADGITTVTEALAGVGGWIKNRVVQGLTDLKEDFLKIGGKVIGWIVEGLTSGGKVFQGFVNKLIDVLNEIPGVKIPKVSLFRKGGVVDARSVPGMATGGVVHHDDWFAKGGEITRPMVVVGEEAPKHPEYVIPTNPAYRGRALTLYAQLSRQLGVPGFALGGVLDRALPSPKDILGAPSALLEQGAKFILDKLPGVGDLPAWMKGMGTYVLAEVKKWIKDKVGDIVPGGGGAENLGTGLVKTLQQAMTLAVRSGLTITSTTGGQHAPGSYHYSGRAFDASNGFGPTPQMMRYAQFMSRAARQNLLELFYTPLGYSIKHGQVTAPIAAAGHFNHVHVAMAKGGVLGGTKTMTGPFVGSYRNGGVIPRDGLAYVHQGETVTPAGAPSIYADIWIGGERIDERVEVKIRESSRTSALQARAGVVSR
ncbi:phage tail tape measure protein [Conexibacter sp. W3-3-2]|uniref:phage tail tape measure protein n=1 Tax=Conexibacter sp. W3-3-2 TaxID=2675227 RepID=UPI0012B7BD7A|nr:phage tail tape measure protein [Conexibacter sp. W3-3-2]MTD43433.1 phage tail tape measure protein [Conexibacter sp. W3-3-2]